MQCTAGAMRTAATPFSSHRILAPLRAVQPMQQLARRQKRSGVVAVVDTEKPSPQKNPNKPEVAKAADSLGEHASMIITERQPT